MVNVFHREMNTTLRVSEAGTHACLARRSRLMFLYSRIISVNDAYLGYLLAHFICKELRF